MIEIFGTQFPFAYIHLGTLALTVVAILFADEAGLAWMRGKKETLSRRHLYILHTAVGTGLTAMILSGIYLAWPLKDYFVQTPAFWVKMFFVLVLVVNSFFIGKYLHVATEKPFAELSAEERRPLFISGGLSALGWLGAFIAALFMTTSNWLSSIFTQILGLF